MKDTSRYDDLFTFSKDAQLWGDLYEQPTELFHHHMALRRDYAHAYAVRSFPKAARILDLGCGAGVLTERLMDSGFKVTGADVSHDMVALARKRLERFPSDDYRLLQATCEDLPFDDGEFDVVICMGVFGYVANVDRAIAEIRRVLKPDGVFFMSVRNRANGILWDPYRMAVWGLRGIAQLLGLRRLKRLLAKRRSAHQDTHQRFHIVIHDSPRNVVQGISARGFTLESLDGFGFGPISLFKKEILPLSLSVKISDWLNRSFRKTFAGAVKLADVNMYVFRKNRAELRV